MGIKLPVGASLLAQSFQKKSSTKITRINKLGLFCAQVQFI